MLCHMLQITDAFPAVTTPSFLNTGFNFAKLSAVVAGLVLEKNIIRYFSNCKQVFFFY